MPDEKDPLFAARAIERRRRALGISARELARRAGLSPTIVRMLEKGESDVRNSYTGTLRGLARALDWSLGELYAAIGIQESREDVLAQLTHLEVDDDSVRFPVYPASAAGDRDAQPPAEGVAIFSTEHLEHQGAKPAWIRVYRWDDACIVSDEASNTAMIRPGDHLAIDTQHKPKPGDVAAHWWPEHEVLVLTRHQIDHPGTVLTPADATAPRFQLPEPSELQLVGRFALRTG